MKILINFLVFLNFLAVALDIFDFFLTMEITLLELFFSDEVVIPESVSDEEEPKEVFLALYYNRELDAVYFSEIKIF